MGGKKKEKKNAGGPPAQEGPTTSVCSGGECKKGATRFGFCKDHFAEYKFGLINKVGAKVPDYDKKFEHFAAHKERQSAQKVA